MSVKGRPFPTMMLYNLLLVESVYIYNKKGYYITSASIAIMGSNERF